MTNDKKTIYCNRIVGHECCSTCWTEVEDGYSDPFETELEDAVVVHCCMLKLPDYYDHSVQLDLLPEESSDD